ncbi:MAG: pyrrolo-quinoline quinone [Candidatus Acidiferrales bacterium]
MLVTSLLACGILLTGCDRKSQRDGSARTSGPVASTDPPMPMYNDVNVLTYHNDNARTGQYLNESVLTPRNVSAASFGKVGFLPVQGLVDAEPLYVEKLVINDTLHRVILVATEHDLVYAFDADTFTQLWRVSLLGAREITSDNRGCQQVTPEIGVTSTPVIDLKAGPHGTIYVVAMSKDHEGHYFQRLHALDIATGAEMHNSPMTIEATFPGSGSGSKNGRVIFDPKQYKDRAALLLASGVIYTTWASHCDNDPYTGWVIGYDESTLNQAGVLNLTANGTKAAIWMTGDGPAADPAGNVYLLTGNGTFDTTLDPSGFPAQGDYGNAFVKLGMRGGRLSVIDYFTMHDTIAQSEQDEDLGSGGILLLPDMMDSSKRVRHLAIGAGKDQIIYTVDRDSMGKFNATEDKVFEKDIWALGGMEFASPAYFNNTVYYGAYKDYLRAFPIANGVLPRLPASQTSKKFDYPGITPSISANGTSNGIVWAVENSVPATLHAYAAADLSNEIYNSNQAGARNQFGHNKFIAPMIADGKVYVGTPTGVIVFGLLK